MPLDLAEKTARSRGMDIDVIGAAINQSTLQQPLDIGAVAHIAEVVDTHIVGIIRTYRDQSMTYNLWNDFCLLETLAGLGVEENRAWCPIDAMGPPEMIGTEQHKRAGLRFCKAVSARRGVLGDLPVQSITGVITASVPEADCARSVHRDAAETDHRMAFEMRYEGRA